MAAPSRSPRPSPFPAAARALGGCRWVGWGRSRAAAARWARGAAPAEPRIPPGPHGTGDLRRCPPHRLSRRTMSRCPPPSATSWTPGRCRWASPWCPSTPSLATSARSTSCWTPTPWWTDPPSSSEWGGGRQWQGGPEGPEGQGMVPPPVCPRHSYTWIVPVTWMTHDATGERYWLTKVSGTARPARAGSGRLAASLGEVGVPRGDTGGGLPRGQRGRLRQTLLSPSQQPTTSSR